MPMSMEDNLRDAVERTTPDEDLATESQRIRRALFTRTMHVYNDADPGIKDLINTTKRVLTRLGFELDDHGVMNTSHWPTPEQFETIRASGRKNKKTAAAKAKATAPKPVKPVKATVKTAVLPAIGQTVAVYLLHQDANGAITVGIRNGEHAWALELKATSQ